MSFSYEDRLSDSPYVRTIWRTQSDGDGCYMAAADGSWDLLVVRQGGEVRVEFAGPATRAAPIAYTQGSAYLPGAHRQIERARHAAALLQAGIPILGAVHATGYADQSHMTRALKRSMGQTPAHIARANTP